MDIVTLRTMVTQKTFKNATLRTVNNGFIELDCENKVHCFHNASVVSIQDGVITIQIEWVPKNGELIKVEGEDCLPHYVIFTSKHNRMLYGYGFVNTNLNPYGSVKFYHFVWQLGDKTQLRPVTPEEVMAFEEFCKAKGFIWNAETFKWEEYKWKPKPGEQYWCAAAWGKVISRRYLNTPVDQGLLQLGNAFPTIEQAEKAAVKMIQFFKSL